PCEALLFHVFFDGLSQCRKRLTEFIKAMKLRLTSDGTPRLMIPVLLAATHIVTRCLHVSVMKRAYPHFCPRRRNSKLLYTINVLTVSHQFSAEIICKTVPLLYPSNAVKCITYILKAGFSG